MTSFTDIDNVQLSAIFDSKITLSRLFYELYRDTTFIVRLQMLSFIQCMRCHCSGYILYITTASWYSFAIAISDGYPRLEDNCFRGMTDNFLAL
jgi:hypothetical protein